MKRLCLERGCPHYATTGPRCSAHTRARDTLRQARRGNYYTAHDYRNRRRACIEEQPWCSVCGATTDLTADHLVPGDPDSPLRTLCRGCNSARANRSRARRAR